MKIVAGKYSKRKLSFTFLYKVQNVQENMSWQIVSLDLVIGEET